MTKTELTNIIYDTLMQNKQHVQFDINKVENQEVDASIGTISFDYDGLSVTLGVSDPGIDSN